MQEVNRYRKGTREMNGRSQRLERMKTLPAQPTHQVTRSPVENTHASQLLSKIFSLQIQDYKTKTQQAQVSHKSIMKNIDSTLPKQDTIDSTQQIIAKPSLRAVCP